jgi:hypothetical protein
VGTVANVAAVAAAAAEAEKAVTAESAKNDGKQYSADSVFAKLKGLKLEPSEETTKE